MTQKTNPSRPTQTISQNLSLSLAVCVTVAVLIFSGIFYQWHKTSLQDNYNRYAIEKTRRLAEVLATPIWNFEDGRIQIIGDGAVLDQVSRGIRVLGEGGEVLYEAGELAAGGYVTEYREVITREGKPLGEVVTYLTKESYVAELGRVRILIGSTLLSTVVILVLFTGYFLRVFLKQPIEALQDSMKRVAEGGEVASIEDASRSEFSGITETFLKMTHNVRERERELRESAADLADTNEQLTEEIAERKAAVHRQKLMVAELDHRVKNNMASILGLMEQTVNSSRTLEGFEMTFAGRVRSLARTHEMLAAGHWEGVELGKIIRTVIAPLCHGADSLEIQIEPSVLPARMVVPLSLALYEMGTNAVKYGALSRPEGKLVIKAGVDGEQVLHLWWVEAGGPITAAPTKTSTGTDVIKGLIGYELGGEISLDFRETGLVGEITIGLEPFLPKDAGRFELKVDS